MPEQNDPYDDMIQGDEYIAQLGRMIRDHSERATVRRDVEVGASGETMDTLPE